MVRSWKDEKEEEEKNKESTGEREKETGKDNKTRPDTRPIPVADGWAGAEMRVFTLSKSITMADQRTDGQSLL